MNNVNRVAINTILQYFQLIVNVLVGFITVRIILGALGKVDYGIYSLILGVVVLIAFISTALAQTSIRFLSVSYGTGDVEKTKEIFASCFSVHLYMSLVLFVLLEVIGLFLFDGFLNIPEYRIPAAKIIYHCMTVTLFLQVCFSPFSALVIVHEKFIVSSLLSITDAFLKLAIAFAVAFTTKDKLVVYGVLMMFITLFNVFCYQVWDWRHYRKLISLKFISIKKSFSVFSFAGWTMLDTFAPVANRQGYQVILNKFYGPETNTVFALAGQVEGHLYSISASVISAMGPQIMKSFGAGDKERSLRLSLTAGKFGFSMMSLLAIPVMVMMPQLLNLWLKVVPEGTIFFARMMLAACMFLQLTQGLIYANQAIGKIKMFSIVVSTMRVLAMPTTLLLFILGFPATYSMIVYFIFESLASFSRVIVMHFTSGLSVKAFLQSVILKILPPFFVASLICWLSYCFTGGLYGIVIASIVAAICYSSLFYFVSLSVHERILLLSVFKSFVKRLKKYN